MKKRIKQAKDDFIRIARMNQTQLKSYLLTRLQAAGYDVISDDGFLYAAGDDVLLTAHMDTVHTKTCKKVYTTTLPNDIIITAPAGIGGDDRCGVWIILDVMQRLLPAGICPAILFCEDEETGGVGSKKFCNSDYIDEIAKLRYFIELDRMHDKDAVFYNDGNTDFHKYIERVTGYETAYGSFSDISNLCPTSGVSGVNLSCGYYEPHTLNEYVVTSEMIHTADTVINLVTDTVKNDTPQFKYIDMWDDCFSDFYDLRDSRISAYEFWFYECNMLRHELYEAGNLYEALGMLMIDHESVRWNDIQEYHTC